MVKGDYQGVFGGYKMTGGVYKHQSGEVSWNVVARFGENGPMRSYWVRRGEFLNPNEQTAYALEKEPLQLRIGKTKNVSEAEKRAVIEAIKEWEAGYRVPGDTPELGALR